MKVVIAGGTGFLGSPLAEAYAEEGHEVLVLTRSLMSGDSRHDPGTGVPGITRVGWSPDGKTGSWAARLEAADAIVNLSGDALDRGRWTPQRKARLRDGRILATRSLAAAILSAAKPPAVLVSGSGVDYYASSNGVPSTESSPPGPISSRTSVRTGRRRHVARNRPAHAWSCSVPVSRWSGLAARCRG